MEFSDEFDFGAATFSDYELKGRIDYLTAESEERELDEDEQAELDDLRAVIDDVAECDTFIADWHFEDYARELAEDIGAIQDEYSWPASHIDWTAAAEALKQDYISVDLRGTEYWAR